MIFRTFPFKKYNLSRGELPWYVVPIASGEIEDSLTRCSAISLLDRDLAALDLMNFGL